MIPYGRQHITEADVDAVIGVLRSDFLTQGPTVPAFEAAVAAACKAQYGVALSSATSALHVACLALGLKAGDRLWTVPNSFVASANCARYCGADVDFVDIDARTWNMSVPALAHKLAQARKANTVPKIVVPVHFSGQPTDQETIWDLAQEYGFKVLEDASHAIGASRSDEPVGSCRWSHATVFSFHPVKIITTCEGGMVLTNDKTLAWRMSLLRSHGITREAAHMTVRTDEGAWYYEQLELGFNYRMTDVHAALGLSQLTRLKNYVERRNVLAKRYDQLLEGFPLQRMTVDEKNYSSYHLYVIRVDVAKAYKSRREVFAALRQRGIGVNVHYMPIHLQPYYRQLGFELGMFPESEKHGAEAITLPLYPELSEAQQDQIVAALHQSLQ